MFPLKMNSTFDRPDKESGVYKLYVAPAEKTYVELLPQLAIALTMPGVSSAVLLALLGITHVFKAAANHAK